MFGSCFHPLSTFLQTTCSWSNPECRAPVATVLVTHQCIPGKKDGMNIILMKCLKGMSLFILFWTFMFDVNNGITHDP